LYLEITKKVKKGAIIKSADHHESYLFGGNFYRIGKAQGRPYPFGSDPKIGPVRNSYPATLEIICETSEKFAEAVKTLNIDECIPRDSRKKLIPSDKWDANSCIEG
jgi:hypothetical protein